MRLPHMPLSSPGMPLSPPQSTRSAVVKPSEFLRLGNRMTLRLSEVSHYWTENRALLVSMRAGTTITITPRPDGESCYDLERALDRAFGLEP